jgi:cytochrome c oxidase assembly factor 6
MGWIPSWLGGSSETPKPEKKALTFPDRATRVKCWDSRDVFFACLDKQGIVDSIKEDEKARNHCSAELKDFDQNCAAAWVYLTDF